MFRMEGTYLSAAEAVEYGEFKRTRREAEISVTLHKLTVDASRRETDRFALKTACESARKFFAYGVLVSPINVAAAKKHLAGSETYVICLVGGTGESILPVKRLEAKKALSQGAKEIRLVLCYSALRAANASYLRREIKKIKRAVRKLPLVVSLEDHSLGEEEVALGAKLAAEAGADAVCVRGETQFVLRALRASGGKIRVDASEVENAEQLRALIKAGSSLFGTSDPERIAKELYDRAREESEQVATVPIGKPVPEMPLGENE